MQIFISEKWIIKANLVDRMFILIRLPCKPAGPGGPGNPSPFRPKNKINALVNSI